MPLLRKALGLESVARLTEPAMVPGGTHDMSNECDGYHGKQVQVWLTCNVRSMSVLVVIVAASLGRLRTWSKCYKNSLLQGQGRLVPGVALPQRKHWAQSAEPINQYMRRVLYDDAAAYTESRTHFLTLRALAEPVADSHAVPPIDKKSQCFAASQK